MPVQLKSVPPELILDKLDLGQPSLEAAKSAAEIGNHLGALEALIAHHRALHPLPDEPELVSTNTMETAKHIVNHVFQWGPYEAADYGDEIQWDWDPRGDIEWVAAIYRFYWAIPLMQAFQGTRDEKYARTFVELTVDWISKHPLESRPQVHPVYTSWKDFPWLDIQTGIRATNICQVFRVFVHAASFTPEFFGVLLASLYDHQVKTEFIPMNQVHNKAVFEQRGFINIAYTFSEFKECRRWFELALERTRKNLLAQTTSDGVQREWSFGYHLGVLRDAVEIRRRMESVGVEVPDDYVDCIRKMYEFILNIATPELGFPMFGDCSRGIDISGDRTTYSLYQPLVEASDMFDDPRFKARADLDRDNLPAQKSYAFSEAGMYVMRDNWGPEQIYFALHCSPKAISSHDQPDNGTFELYAYGRWLMNDTGFYTYGHDPEGRAWHRRSAVHQTLTLDGEDTVDSPKELLWHSSPQLDALVVENQSYERLAHRRSVWFVDKRFFVILDEALGDVEGNLDLHFQLAVGDTALDLDNRQARTLFDDTNILIRSADGSQVEMAEEEGWFAWSYGERKRRTAFRFRHQSGAPAAFLTLMIPYRGTEPPEALTTLPESFVSGDDEVVFEVEAFGELWEIGRNLAGQKAWCSSV